jgi:type IV pilus assembly protein PilC
MPMYSYVVKDRDGKTKKELVEALSEQSLVDKLQNEGYFIISVGAAVTGAPAKAAVKKVHVHKFSHNKVKMEDMLVMSRQMATMLDSGVTLMRTLSVISEQIESRDLHRVITSVKEDVEQGRTLSSSLAKHPKVFSQFWVSLVEVGEASGTMPMVLEKLSLYTEQQAAFRSTITSALVYPGVLFVICVGAILFFALFVAPRFEAIFTSMRVELPGLTVVMLSTFKMVKSKFLFIVAGIVGTVFLFKNFLKTPHGQLAFEKVMFKMPAFGTIYKLIIVERFAAQMAILVESGVPILYALQITEKLVENITCSVIVANVRESVREGKLLAEPMQESGFFPPMCIQMIKVGEETGELGKMLKHIARFYQENVEAFMKRIGTLIEPIMLVFMGGIIGTIVLAMFLPLFSMTG